MASIVTPIAAKAALALAILASAYTRTTVATAGDVVDNDFLPEQVQRDMFEPEDFSIDLAFKIPSAGGVLTLQDLRSDPIMGAMTTGFQQAIYTFEPCGVVNPHVHPRGDENVFAVSGTVEAGFVDEAGKLIRDTDIKAGTAFVVPQGYMHYVANPTCEPATALVTLPSADGGFYSGLGSVLSMPGNILQASVPHVSLEVIEQLKQAVSASSSITVDPVCAARCAEGGDGSYGDM